MRWLALIHLALALVWCLAALRLPTEVARATAEPHPAARGRSRVRRLFIGVATPAAVLAVVTGTALRAGQELEAPWALVHLTIASFLVWSHGATAVVIIRLERHQHRGLHSATRVMCALTLALLLAFSAVVLLAPGQASAPA